MLAKPIAVVGCGHSGTFHIQEIFQHCGIDVRHELVGRDGVAGWNYTHLLRHQFPDFGLPTDAVVLQQIRLPLNVISSVTSMEDATWVAIGSRANSRGISWNPLDEPHPIRGMRYWLLWNQLAERIANYRYRIENLPNVFAHILSLIGVPPVPLPVVSDKMNSHEYEHTYTWRELKAANRRLYQAVLGLSAKYGYT